MKTLKMLLGTYKGLPKTIYVLFIARIINCMGNFVFPLMSLILTQRIGFSKADAGIFITVLAVTQVPSLLLGGKLCDSFGRKKMIIVFQTLGAACYLICGLIKPSIIMAFIIVLASDFYSMSSPAFDALNADITTPENRKSAFSLLYMGLNIGFSISPILGGMMYKDYLSLIFIGDGITTIAATVLIVVFIGESKKSSDRDNELAVEENVCVESAATKDLEKDEEGSLIRVLLKRPVLLCFALIMFIYQFVYSQWGFMLPLQLADVFKKHGALFYGFIASMNGFTVIIFTPIITNILSKCKPLKTISMGGFLYAISFGSLGYISHLPLFFVAMFIMTLGEIMISINSGTFIANQTPASHRGRINSILPIIMGAGYSIGPMVMGRVNLKYGYTVTWSVIGIAMLIGAISVTLLQRQINKSAAE